MPARSPLHFFALVFLQPNINNYSSAESVGVPVQITG